MKQHAILSPSAAHRWLECTPSARLEMQFPDSAGSAAAEGTLAHRLGETIIRQRLKMISKKVAEKEIAEIEANELYDHSMSEHAEAYAVFVLEAFNEALAHTKDAVLHLEHQLNLTDYIEEGFGTGDAVIVANDVLDIIDLKYGKGVHVSAEDNPQMKLYALGALYDFFDMYDIKTVRMRIFQPRIDNYSSYEMAVTDLLAWAEKELKPKAALAYAGEGEFIPGDHCQFCRAKPQCKVFADYNLEIAKHDFAPANLLSDDDTVEILSRAKMFLDWIGSVSEYALSEAVNNGKKWPGYKLVEGKSNRVYTDEKEIGSKLLKAGFAEDLIYKKELLGITAMEKAIGKKVFADQVADLLFKPKGKPTLVPEADKRPEYNSAENAKKDFAEPVDA